MDGENVQTVRGRLPKGLKAEIYSGMATSIFYSYMWFREDGTPYYVGKGSGNRVYVSHCGFRPPNDRSRVLIFPMPNEDEAFESEIALIDLFGRKNNGTGILRNLTNGGEGTSGWEPTPEQVARMRLLNVGRKPSLETRRKMSLARKGRPVPDDVKRKISEAQKGNKNHNFGKKQTPEAVAKTAAANRGQKRSEAFKKRHSEILKGHAVSSVAKEKMRLRKVGIPLREEHKAKIRAALQTDEWKQKSSIAHKGKIPSFETRQKMSRAQIARYQREAACSN